jgi:signal transduction histidine kinase/ligand-binding sensor domain-containing protein/CheY-like chemotaxis protein/HPt (histidine-containing phosphotransfer) domain-containing protein
MKAHIFLLLVTSLFVAAPTSALRQDDYVIKRSPASSALTQQTVNKIYQSKDGFVWFLTAAGLNRFDGYEVVSFRSARGNDGSISNDATSDIVEDSAGTMWVSTLGGGINRYESRDLTFTSVRAGNSINNVTPNSDFVSKMHASSDGSVWLGYSNGIGISRYYPDSGRFVHYFLPDQRPDTPVTGLVETSDGELYISVQGSGVYLLDLGTESIARLNNELGEMPIDPTGLLQLSSGEILITSYETGAFLLDLTENTFTRHFVHEQPGAELLDRILTATQDVDGNLWLGTLSGVAIVSKANDKPIWLTEFNSNLTDDHVLSIFQGSSGMLWLGTYSGLSQATRSLFQKFSAEDGLISNSIQSFESDPDGHWYIGTKDGLVQVKAQEDDAGDWSISETISLLPLDTTSLALDGKHLWAGSLDDGLYRIDTQLNEAKHFKADDTPGAISNNGIPVIEAYGDGRVLVGTYGGGLNVFIPEENSFRVLSHNDNNVSTISDNRVLAILVDSQKRIWVGTQNGLNLLDIRDMTFERFLFDPTNEKTLPSNWIYSLAEDKQGNIWIGTDDGGVSYIPLSSPIEFNQPPAELRTPSTKIYDIVVDDEDSIWLSHADGLTRLNLDGKSAISFDVGDGLQGSEFNFGAAHKSTDGKLLFGGQNGFNIIDGTADYSLDYEPRTQITAITLLNEKTFFKKSYSELSQIDLDYDYQFASIQFAVLDYQRASKLSYRYRIDGIHDEWINLAKSRQISISGLGSGSYQIRLNGSDSNGNWLPTERTLGIYIAPPIWATWYAYSTYAMLLFGGVYLLYRAQQRRSMIELLQRKELETRVEERTADLHKARVEAESAAKAKSDFLAAMSHEIRTPMHGMIGMTDLLLQSDLTVPQREYAATARQSGESLLGIIDSILDYSRLEAGKLELSHTDFDVVDLIEDVATLLSEKAFEQGNALLVFWGGEHQPKVNGDEGKIRQILVNLIGNAIKFTRKGKIYVYGSLNADQSVEGRLQCQIKVKDTGIGIPADKIHRIFEMFTQADASTTRRYGGTGLGLSISKELAELMSGELAVESNYEHGSTFTLTVPIDAAKTLTPNPNLEINAYFAGEDTDVFESIRSRLNLHGIPVTRAPNDAACDTSQLHSSPLLIDANSVDRDAIDLTRYQHPISLSSDRQSPIDKIGSAVVVSPFRTSSLLIALSSAYSTKEQYSAAQTEPHNTKSDSIRVLLVEDVEVNRQIATKMLNSMGIQPDIASNGLEAVNKCIEKQFDVILMDCQMPVLDGYQATRQIRNPLSGSINTGARIVALTAGGTDSDLRMSREAGMDLYVRKPFTTYDLESAIVKLAPPIESSASHKEGSVSNQDFFNAPLDSLPIMDLEVFTSLSSLKRDENDPLLANLLDSFDNQFEKHIDALVSSITDADNEELRISAHAIKSMCANLGARRIQALAESVEKTYRVYDFSRGMSDAKMLAAYKEEFCRVMRNELRA